MSFKINDVWAYVSISKDGDEGICAIKFGDSWMPMIMADENTIRSIRPLAEKLARECDDTKIKLIKFSTRTDVEEL